MDVTNPVVAGTQFTAYMAMFNLAISYSATWQGISIEAWGYPGTMIVDGFYGMLYLLVLPLTRKRPGSLADDNALAPGRARKLGLVLALLCLAWLPVHALETQFGAAKDIVNILFTLVFIASALFLLAGAALLGAVAGRLTRIGAWFSPLLLLMQVRNYQDGLAAKLGVSTQSLGATLDIFLYGVPLLAAVLLWQMSRHAWADLALPPATDGEAGAAGDTGLSGAKLAAAS
jgi:PAT family beta-lactamase induction signal transducer AmpG